MRRYASHDEEALRLGREFWSRTPISRPTPMQDWTWVEACFDALYPNDQPLVLYESDTSHPTAVAAFARRGSLAPTLLLVGASEIGEPVDVLYKDEDAAAALAERVSRLGFAVRFGHFPSQSPFFDAFSAVARKRGVFLSAPVNGSPYITLEEAWRDPLLQLSSRRRSDLRRMARKAEKMGEVSFDFLTPAVESVETFLQDFYAIEAKSWKSRTRTAIADNPLQTAFFNSYAVKAAQQGVLRIGKMNIDGECVAMQLALEFSDSYWLLKIGYDESYGSCSPGNLLMLESIKRAAAKDLESFEFLGKSADWTRVWTETERPNAAMRFYPYSISGLLCLARDSLSVAGMRFRRTLEAWRGVKTGH